MKQKQLTTPSPCRTCKYDKNCGIGIECSRGYVLTAADKQRFLHESYEEGVRNGEFKE